MRKRKKKRAGWFVVINGGAVIERAAMPLWKAKAFAKQFNANASDAGIEARAFAELAEEGSEGTV